MFEPKTPYLAVDGVVRLWEGERFKGIVLIERRYEPLGYALPGGFVEVGETVEEAVLREVKEETGLDAQIVKLLGVYSEPNRDPRFHVVSVVFVLDAHGEPKGGDDAKKALVFPIEDLPFDKIVFDHAKILKDYLRCP
ncbi:MAG: NUDIX domain-containing protein [Thermocrinis sp.]|jgi:8-oxo-dGTP diphosphatase|uniref:NUDIX hydrolase n=1 Tax=Thermocrinis sp. TaxID=2024383 RepID=UPI00157E5E7F|nr:NUDIX hydrolase [Thermocrinis sp.]NAZ22955.1 NUDIX domain-containing protein [Thermocrinis sp.]